MLVRIVFYGPENPPGVVFMSPYPPGVPQRKSPIFASGPDISITTHPIDSGTPPFDPASPNLVWLADFGHFWRLLGLPPPKTFFWHFYPFFAKIDLGFSRITLQDVARTPDIFICLRCPDLGLSHIFRFFKIGFSEKSRFLGSRHENTVTQNGKNVTAH